MEITNIHSQSPLQVTLRGKKVYGAAPNNPIAAFLLKKADTYILIYAEWKNEVEQYKKYINFIVPEFKNEILEMND